MVHRFLNKRLEVIARKQIIGTFYTLSESWDNISSCFTFIYLIIYIFEYIFTTETVFFIITVVPSM